MQPIAIIGASCRFPGANGLDEFWQLLREARNAVSTVPTDRWDPDALLDDDPSAPANVATRHGGFIQGIRKFDCGFFGISPREASAMDPQQRLLLETSYEAFEDAGVPMDALAGSKTAVYVGIGPGDYGRMCVQPGQNIDAHYVTGNFLSTAVDRIAYFFDLRGPSMAIDTACSSSLVALHLACRSLESGEADLALAGGVNALLSPALSISLAKAGALSPTGHCRSFDANADGYVRGEGSGFVVLKRLADARAGRDRIYAIVRGTAVKQGGRRNGLTAPGGWGEEAVMDAAWQASGIAPAQADYVEVQGTGTVLGDAIEANALAKIFGARNGRGPCRIGSVKTNIGHLETAAGIASLIKVALMMSHRQFVPSLYPEKPNPHVNFEKLGLSVQTRNEVWAKPPAGLRATGVSSFGMGGTYAHICLIEPEGPSGEETHGGIAPELLLPLSARHPNALRQLVGETVGLIRNLDQRLGADLCSAAALRRSHHEYRVAFAALSPEALVASMDCWLQESKPKVERASAQRKLVVLTPEPDEFKEAATELANHFKLPVAQDKILTSSEVLLGILESWGIRASRTLRVVQGRLLQSKCETVSAEESAIGLDELRSTADDFLDLTREKFLRDFEPRKGVLLSGFSSSEPTSLTPLRLAAVLYRLGYPLAWHRLYRQPAKQVNFPRYPWQHQVCWRETLDSVSTVVPRPDARTPAPSSKVSLAAVLSRVTGRSLREIRPDVSPAELGIDSLMTLELQAELKRSFGALLPVESLVTVGSVSELEHLLTTTAEDSAPAPRTAAPAAPVIRQPRRPVEIRQASLSDHEGIVALTSRTGLGKRTREHWLHTWVNNPVYKRQQNWPIGWVVQEGTEIVGFLGTIPVSYQFQGREILAVGLHAFALDVAHRGQGLLLLNRLMDFTPDIEYFLGSSTNANSAKVLDRLGIGRIPVGDWENSRFWITDYDGFAGSVMSRKAWPGALASPASLGLRAYDKLLKSSWPEQKHELHRQNGFDERFDRFWQDLQRAYPNRFLATRSREVLDWHFKFSLAEDRAWVVTYEKDSRILAYAIFYRHNNRELNLKKVRLADCQFLPGSADVLPSILAWGLRESRAQRVHMFEVFGFRLDKQRVIDRLAPHRRKLTSWTYFHKAVSPALQQALQDPEVWDPSPFDGDASL